MIEGFSLGNYMLLVDYAARLYPEGRATQSRAVAEILDQGQVPTPEATERSVQLFEPLDKER